MALFPQPDTLNDREIAHNQVRRPIVRQEAAQIAEREGGRVRERRLVEIVVEAILDAPRGHCRLARAVRPLRAAERIRGVGGGSDVERQAALNRGDTVQAPAAAQQAQRAAAIQEPAALAEGQIVLVVHHQTVCNVERGQRPVGAQIVVIHIGRIRLAQESGDRRVVVQQLRPCVGSEQLQAAAVALAEFHLQRVIGGVRKRPPRMGDAGELRIRTQKLALRGGALADAAGGRDDTEKRIRHRLIQRCAQRQIDGRQLIVIGLRH